MAKSITFKRSGQRFQCVRGAAIQTRKLCWRLLSTGVYTRPSNVLQACLHSRCGMALNAGCIWPATALELSLCITATLTAASFSRLNSRHFMVFPVLKPGQVLSLSSAHAGPVTSAFWSAVEVAREGTQTRSERDDASVIGELGAILKDAVRLEMMADVPLGAFLSGGIDSSLVVALMQAQSSRPVKTFTIGFNEDEFNEAQHAKKIARHLGTEHTELYLSGNDALKVIPLLASMYDEPFADSSQIPTYMVSKLAREHVTVSLSGDGGDEVFGGYSRYFRAKQVWNITKRIPGPLARTMAAMIGACSCSSLDRLLGWAPLPEMLKPPGPKLQEFAA